MNITKEMIGAAHDIMLQRGDFILSADMLAKIYEAMQNREPMENRDAVERDAMRYRELRQNERFSIDEKCADGHWEPIRYDWLDDAMDRELSK
jgi:hypothetical protein